MASHTLQRRTWIDAPVDEVFAFFSDARNLERLTPPFLGFRILTPEPIEMRPGTLIDDRIRLHGLPLRWRSEITAWEPPHRFVDEQRRGPFRSWVHEHRFEARDGGTEVTDTVRYSVLGGALVERLFVRRDLARIFDGRAERLAGIFPPSAVTDESACRATSA